MSHDRAHGPAYDLDTGRLADFSTSEPGSIPAPIMERARAAFNRDPVLAAWAETGAAPTTFSGEARPDVVERMLKATPAGRQVLKERMQAGQTGPDLRHEAKRRVEAARSPQVVRGLRGTPIGRAVLKRLEEEEYQKLLKGGQP